MRFLRYAGLRGQKLGMKSFALEFFSFFIAARFVNLAVSLPQYQFASHNSVALLRNRRTSVHCKGDESCDVCKSAARFH